MSMKKKWIYIITLICSLYITYLIVRLHAYSLKSIIVIAIIVFSIFGYLTYLYRKNTEYKRVNKKSWIVLASISALLAVGIIGINCDIVIDKFKETEITIASKENLEIQNAIKYMIVDNTYYTIQGNGLLNNARALDTAMKIENNKNSISIKLPKSISIKIVFYSGYNNITIIDGANTNVINNSNESTAYEITSNKTSDNWCIIRFAITCVLLTYIILNTILIIKYTKNKQNRYFIITMLIVILGTALYIAKYEQVVIYPDTWDYINFNFREILKLNFQGRTPIYPLIIKICRILFESRYLEAVVLVQYLIGIVSSGYFYKMLRLIIKNGKIISLFTIIYALCPAIIGWNGVILTESIAISGTVIIMYYIIKYIKIPKISTGATAIILSLVLTFHRPTAIIYVVAIEAFWIGRFMWDRSYVKIDLKCFAMSTISIILIIIYAIIFHKSFGIYSISDVVVRQNLYVCIHEGFYKASDNEQFIKDVEEAISMDVSKWDTMELVENKYTCSELQEITNYCRMQNLGKYIKYIYRLSYEHQMVKYDNYALGIEENSIQRIWRSISLFITFSHVYCIVAIEFIIVIYKWIKDKKVPWIHCGLFGFPFVIILSSFIGTNAEFMRTSICVMPFAYVSIAIYIDYISKLNAKK